VGYEDTHIYQYASSANYCHDSALKVGYKQRNAALLRFELSSIPASAVVTEATLQVYAKGWGGVDMTLDAHCVLREVEICEATWNQAGAGNWWGQAGCNDTLSDRRVVVESSVRTDSVRKWCSFDLTSLVQGWVNGSAANEGVLLRGSSSLSTGLFYFASAENGDVRFRPKLVITYQGSHHLLGYRQICAPRGALQP